MNYQNRVCLFIDILGFSEHIKETTDKNGKEVVHKVEEIVGLLNLLPIKIKSFGKKVSDRQITQFSDSIVVSFQLSDNDAFIELLDYVMLVVVNFLAKGYLVRGGISYGKLLHKDNIVFGPAMISAYELESKIAVYPRIIFDKELVEELIKNGDNFLKSLFQNEFESSNFWKEDFDGKYYLNFFKGSEIYMDTDYYHGQFLPQLRDFIAKAWRNRVNQSVRTKFGWLRTKFNEHVDYINENQSGQSRNLIKKIT